MADTKQLNGFNKINQAEYMAKHEAKRTAKNQLGMRNQIHYSKHFYNFPMRMFMQNTTPHTYSNTVWILPEIGIVHTVHLALLLNGMLKSFTVREGPALCIGAHI